MRGVRNEDVFDSVFSLLWIRCLGMSDDDSIPYQPVRIDYMRDVFRPKQFVKEAKEVKPVELYHSVYDNLNVKTDVVVPIADEDDSKALELYKRIQEIERKHEGNNSRVVSSTFPYFQVDRCACNECSPIIQENGGLFCELCQMVLREDTWVSHFQSICHQLRRSQSHHVYINPYMKSSSFAYHLLESMGWTEGEGLGRDHHGRLEPIPTRLKRNRLGVGAKDDRYFVVLWC